MLPIQKHNCVCICSFHFRIKPHLPLTTMNKHKIFAQQHGKEKTQQQLQLYPLNVLFSLKHVQMRLRAIRRHKVAVIKKKKMCLENGDMLCSFMCHFPHNTAY